MLMALDDAGVAPDVVLGTSIGALNGSVIADGPGPVGVKRLADFWEEASGADLFRGNLVGRMKNVATLKPSIHETAEIRTILEHLHSPDKLIEDLATPFQCVAASIERAAEHWFTSGPLIDAVLASSAIPALFPPYKIGHEHFYDGGLVNSVPLTRASGPWCLGGIRPSGGPGRGAIETAAAPSRVGSHRLRNLETTPLHHHDGGSSRGGRGPRVAIRQSRLLR